MDIPGALAQERRGTGYVVQSTEPNMQEETCAWASGTKRPGVTLSSARIGGSRPDTRTSLSQNWSTRVQHDATKASTEGVTRQEYEKTIPA